MSNIHSRQTSAFEEFQNLTLKAKHRYLKNEVMQTKSKLNVLLSELIQKPKKLSIPSDPGAVYASVGSIDPKGFKIFGDGPIRRVRHCALQ